MIKFINNLPSINDEDKLSKLDEKLMEDLESKNEFVCYAHFCQNYV